MKEPSIIQNQQRIARAREDTMVNFGLATENHHEFLTSLLMLPVNSLVIFDGSKLQLPMYPIMSNSVNLKMNKTFQFTAVIEREGDGYVSLCPELDIASQGDTVEQATANLKEAVELFFESASRQEIMERTHGEVFVTRLEVAIG